MLSVRRFLLGFHVLFAVVTGSLMPIASSIAQADVVEDFMIWENLTVRGNFGFINPDNPDLKRWVGGGKSRCGTEILDRN